MPIISKYQENNPYDASAWFEQVRDLTLALMRFPSVTGTPDEVAFAQQLYDLLARRAYFTAHPGDLRIERAPGDPHGRSNVFALVRGAGPETVLLTGHYDVVGVANYGDLAPYAGDPIALLPRLIAELEAGAPSAAERLALDDLRGGAFMAGRGALDMKSGLAAGIAVLDRFAGLAPCRGNLLLIATPDEEQNSEGMRAAVSRLPALAAEWGLEPIAAINLDSAVDRGDGGDGQAIFMGSVGKLLPSVYLAGRDTHAGAPFDGVGANLLAAEITRRIECNPALADRAEGEVAPPPVGLKQADLKQGYDVTTPAAAWCYYNLLTHSWSPSEVLAKMVHEVQQALDDAIELLRGRARRYAQIAGGDVAALPWRARALTFAELKRLALDRGGVAVEMELARLTESLRDDLSVDLPLYCQRVTELLWRHSGLTGPAAVVGFASLYYPRVLVGDAPGRHAQLRAAAERQAAALAQAAGVSIRLRPFFPGISDMSFLGCADAAEELVVVSENTPAWGTRLRFDYSSARELDVPVINVGPWGRDYHQRLERVYMPYSFGVMPELVWRIASDLLGESLG
jgi:arginine utilization protein RocB